MVTRLASRPSVHFWTVLLWSALCGGGLAAAGEPPAEAAQPEGATPALLQEMKNYRHKIVFETNRDGNWELYLMNADGSNPVNLTNTPDVDEVYAKASPDGTKICLVADERRKGGSQTLNLHLMNSDGTERVKIADNAREPCWSADGKQIAYLKGEFGKFDPMDFVTKGLFIRDVATGQVREHPNKNIHHLYCLNWTPDGNWFVATVHGGMGFRHSILALGANNDKVFDLKLNGCRPDVSPDGKKIIWGHGDFAVGLANLELTADTAKATVLYNVVQSKEPVETYHADWSPDGKYIVFTRGSKAKGRPLGLAPEIPTSDAPGWNTCIADAAQKTRWVAITTDGKSNKEPDWVFVKEGVGK
jgi:Tol biopolymer transport system component